MAHNKYEFYSPRLVWIMGPAIFVAALAGGMTSKWVSNHFLLALFACLALVAAMFMFLPRNAEDADAPEQEVAFSRAWAVAIAAAIGLLGGLVGQGGSFILIPLMLYVLHIPTRVAIASNLPVVLMSSSAAFLGKLGTLQIPLALAGALVLGVVPGARLGAALSRRMDVRALRVILALLISLAAVRIWMKVLL
jgi:hypothetical protein